MSNKQTTTISLKPRHIASALDGVTPRRAGDWLRGERSPDVTELARILRAFPDLDARELVTTIADRRAAKAGAA